MMLLPLAFCDEPTKQEELVIQNKLGQSKFTVYKTYSASRKQNYALKTFSKTPFGTTQYEREKLMGHLEHRNVIQGVPVRCQHEKFHVLLFEYSKIGDFFKLVTEGFMNDEILVRTYFHQLINGLEYIHKQGLAHLDLKLENILMGSDYQLKIADFDLSQPIVETRLVSEGTKGYRAPEVLEGTAKNLATLDVYSAGIILYAFQAKEFLFVEMADPQATNYLSYSTFKNKRESFWKSRAERKNKKVDLSKDLIELLNGMLDHQPSKRFTISQVKNSNWYKGPTLNNEELRQRVQARLVQMNNIVGL